LSKSEETDEKNSKSTDDARIDKALKRKMERKKKSKAKKAAKQQKLAEVAKEEFYENPENFFNQMINPMLMFNFANNYSDSPSPNMDNRASFDVCSPITNGVEKDYEIGMRRNKFYSEGMETIMNHNNVNYLKYDGHQMPSNDARPNNQSMYYNHSQQISQMDSQNYSYYNNSTTNEISNNNGYYENTNPNYCYERPSFYNEQSTGYIQPKLSEDNQECYNKEINQQDFEPDMSSNLVKDLQNQIMTDKNLSNCVSSYKYSDSNYVDDFECRVDSIFDQADKKGDNSQIKKINTLFCYNSNEVSTNKGSTVESDNEEPKPNDYDLKSELNQNMKFISDWLNCGDETED